MSYEELKAEISGLPLSMLPGILVHVVRECVRREVFSPGGMQRTIDRTVEGASK